jgi:uncharacterized protein
MISTTMLELISRVDLDGLKALLFSQPERANEGLPLTNNPTKAHPLHRICDGVKANRYTDKEAVEMARILLEYGAWIDGGVQDSKMDTPLIAASSLQADEVALLLIDHGAGIHQAGTHGGTALHWAAWCGRDRIVDRLIRAGADVNQQCIDFTSTPLLWAVHGHTFGGKENVHRQFECARLLIQAGSDKSAPNVDGKKPHELLRGDEPEWRALLKTN